MSLRKTVFGRQKAKVNTYIGGIGATINTPALLASKLGISASRIKLFKVTGVDVECAVVGNISTAGDWRDDISLTYYFSEAVTDLGANTWVQDCDNLMFLEFPNVIIHTGGAIGRNCNKEVKVFLRNCTKLSSGAFYESSFSGKKTIYIPKVTELGNVATIENVFTSLVSGTIIYCHPSLATSNSGAVEGDLQYAISRGAIIRYVTNFTPPNAITNLSAGTIYNMAIQLNFTPPSSTNGIDFYEVYINGEIFNSKEIKNSGEFITGLLPNTTYKIEVKAVDMFYNKSVFSNAINFTTTNTVLDVDANAYMIASDNGAWQPAINSLFTDLKTQGLYTKLQAFYPFLGTTQAQHKWNGKNPLDTNAVFRLQFFGGGTHSNLGYQCNGTNAYANTFLNPRSILSLNNSGVTIVVGTNNATVASSPVDVGSNDGTTSFYINSKANNTTYSRRCAAYSSNIVSDGLNKANGIFSVIRNSTTNTFLYENKNLLTSGSSGGIEVPNNSITIGVLNRLTAIQGSNYSNQRIQFTAIHEGLTDAEVVALHTIIDNFEAAIGRKTW